MVLQLPSLSRHQHIQQCLKNFSFQRLFIEILNWNIVKLQDRMPIVIPENGRMYRVIPFAEKANLVVYRCVLDTNDPALSQHKVRAKIDKIVATRSHEHIIIFSDTARTKQFWLWVKREPGRPLARREEHFERNQSGERLAQKLESLHIYMGEEEGLTISTVTGKVSRAFDSEPMTKKFFKRFKDERTKFFRAVKGITSDTERYWYTTLMLSRLMLVYFIQKKSLLNGDIYYLQNRMQEVREKQGQENFYTFYRSFLLRLFHEGLSSNERTQELQDLLKEVPYLNGSLFDKHELEEKNRNIHIPDETFTDVLTFFDDFTWHLDSRPLHNDKEINPDVLGYIFEQLVNEEENNQGVYYTKEDITEYIAKNTILPYLLRTVAQKYPEAFVPTGPVWSYLQTNPDRYIYDAIKKGCSYSLPLDIQEGVSDVTRRKRWNEVAPDDVGSYALPIETWREMIERHTLYKHVYKKLKDGEIQSIDDLITYNLDICQFVQDIIDNCEDVRLLYTLYFTITGRAKTSRTTEELPISILDPTCGSGAFLLSALNILQPIYQACLQRMQDMRDETLLRLGSLQSLYMVDFDEVLTQVDAYPNQDFFIMKSIIVNNLYGVDMMKESNEICKLRLFLKLMAYVDSYEQAKPLPNVDFNIYTGNSLVGFIDMEDAREPVLRDMGSKLISEKTLQLIEKTMGEVEQAIEGFRIIQMEPIPQLKDVREWKVYIRRRVKYLRLKLNRYLAAEYGIDRHDIPDKKAYLQQLKQWEETHQPLHWFMEFDKIMRQGGFNVIIGNPPYAEYSKIKKNYTVKNYKTERCNNLYAFIMERSLALQSTNGCSGMIVPISLLCTKRMIPLQKYLLHSCQCWNTSFDTSPSQLFTGVSQRLSINLYTKNASSNTIYLGGYRRWHGGEREALIASTSYIGIPDSKLEMGSFPKIATPIEASIIAKLQGQRISEFEESIHRNAIYVHRIIRYFVKAVDFVPYFWNEREGQKRSEDYKPFYFKAHARYAIAAILNSSLFYWFWHVYSDGFHCGYQDVRAFKLGAFENSIALVELQSLGKNLMQELQRTTTRKTSRSKTNGNTEYDEFNPRVCFSRIEQIDRILAQHYGFTDEELDFIINYDIKYRMGKQRVMDEDES